tara:strand:+ start:364 stop:633 length:270 start_codon:yes stop_codon:yes gene_type:complete
VKKIKFLNIPGTQGRQLEIFIDESSYPIGKIINHDQVRGTWKIKPYFTVLVERKHEAVKEFFDMSKAANALVNLYEYMNYWEDSLFKFD